MTGKTSSQAGKVYYTSAEVIENRIPYRESPPEPTECKFCGKTLYYEAIVFTGRVITWNRKYPQRCDCEQAQAYWREWDKHQSEKKMRDKLNAQKTRHEARIEKLFNRSGIKKRFERRTFDTFKITSENKKAFEKSKEYAENFRTYFENGQGIYFEGTYGTGKTHLASAIALELIFKGVPVIFRTSIDLLTDIKQAYDDCADTTESEIIDDFKEINLLIIDDLGKEQCTEWSMPILYSIINDRYETMKPTIITTNYNEKMLINRLTPKGGDNTNARAIISRLRECTECVTMAFEDYREGNA